MESLPSHDELEEHNLQYLYPWDIKTFLESNHIPAGQVPLLCLWDTKNSLL